MTKKKRPEQNQRPIATFEPSEPIQGWVTFPKDVEPKVGSLGTWHALDRDWYLEGPCQVISQKANSDGSRAHQVALCGEVVTRRVLS